jgi:hypothetical protein
MQRKVMPVTVAQTAGDHKLSFAGNGSFTKYSQESLRIALKYGTQLAHMIKKDFSIYRQQQIVPIAIKSAHFSVN